MLPGPSPLSSGSQDAGFHLCAMGIGSAEVSLALAYWVLGGANGPLIVALGVDKWPRDGSCLNCCTVASVLMV